MQRTIITPVADNGLVAVQSILVQKSWLRILLEKTWRYTVNILALIGFGTVLSWLI